jgi:localization factor PodJL
MYARGQGVTEDLVAAYKWLGVAAKAGDAQSQFRLPRLARQLPAGELAEAEALIRVWRPGR